MIVPVNSVSAWASPWTTLYGVLRLDLVDHGLRQVELEALAVGAVLEDLGTRTVWMLQS